MKKYIQKEELEQGVNDLLLKCLDNDNLSQQYSMGYIGAITNVIGLIERLSKMATKVKSAKWLRCDCHETRETWVMCSCCGKQTTVLMTTDYLYCPKCGTKMNTQ